jgi:hypothetical protein
MPTPQLYEITVAGPADAVVRAEFEHGHVRLGRTRPPSEASHPTTQLSPGSSSALMDIGPALTRLHRADPSEP